jgi:endonuclease YncB( thermonuclease family)
MPTTAIAVLTCLVVGVSDGDTLTARCRTELGAEVVKMRLFGVDAPEKGQAFGQVSKQSLTALTRDKAVEASCHKIDRYGRQVCKVATGGVDVGLQQVRAGLAWHYKAFEREQSPDEWVAYSKGELAAQIAKRGLWQDAEPVPPWEWRKSHR